MKQEANDVLIESTTATKAASPEYDIIPDIDPLIEPLIDADELDELVHDAETSNRFAQKCVSILTLNQPKDCETTSTCSHVISRCTGIFYALLSSCLFTCSGFIIKQLRVDFFDAMLVRFVVQTSILTTFTLYKKNKFLYGSRNLILLQIFRAMIAISGLFLFYTSYHYIPLPDVTTCRYTQVMWITIISMIVFHERISIVSIFSIIFTLTGVTLVAQPTFLFTNQQIATNITNITNFEADKSYRFLGLSLALACALSNSFNLVLNKRLILSKMPQSLIMFQFSFLGLCMLILYHLYNRFIMDKYAHQTMFTWQFFLAAFVSLMQVCSSTLTQKALKLEHPAIISVATSSDILFAIILQNLFTKVKSNVFVLIGSILVIASIFLVGMKKFWQDKKKFSDEKKIDTKV